MEKAQNKYDVLVIGGGHAGCEAALAAARLGCRTAMITLNLDAIGNLPCNPSIGGTGKGHLVREIDAIGGQMGKVADQTFLQSRMLNKGKGPAVHSLRVQSDRRRYQQVMKHVLERQESLDVIQAEVTKLVLDEKKVTGVVTRIGERYEAHGVVLATGTYLKGRVIVGESAYPSGPDGMNSADFLSESLRQTGVSLLRFKTGTPPRVRRSSIDFSGLEEQKGDEVLYPFSFETEHLGENKVSCYLTYTTERTHQIIRENLHRSPLFSGMIEGVGPRYCPSIEDKVTRFADKARHQIFVEPMGLDTEEMYIQGFSSSLPFDVQKAMLESLPGFENAKIMRNAYAIEYDCVDPLELKPSLELKKIEGLFGAGQFNGSSGYEEAAAQGLIAGINAARKVKGQEAIVIDRSQAYIGTLIDDLVTKGTQEPYRIMTSRSEYRLLLRQDNADQRLTPLGHEIGLVSEERYARYLEKMEAIAKEKKRLFETVVSPTEALNQLLVAADTAPVETGIRLSTLICRPQLCYEMLAPVDSGRPVLPREIFEQAQIEYKYEGYIRRQKAQVEQFKKMEQKKLPQGINYDKVLGLRIEARQKLNQIKPENLGQASRISGVNPADISVLVIYLEQRG